ncbi:unnamed protein product, partial [Pylaiella littoralis]
RVLAAPSARGLRNTAVSLSPTAIRNHHQWLNSARTTSVGVRSIPFPGNICIARASTAHACTDYPCPYTRSISPPPGANCCGWCEQGHTTRCRIFFPSFGRSSTPYQVM